MSCVIWNPLCYLLPVCARECAEPDITEVNGKPEVVMRRGFFAGPLGIIRQELKILESLLGQVIVFYIMRPIDFGRARSPAENGSSIATWFFAKLEPVDQRLK